jgi:hypothetical protein
MMVVAIILFVANQGKQIGDIDVIVFFFSNKKKKMTIVVIIIFATNQGKINTMVIMPLSFSFKTMKIKR